MLKGWSRFGWLLMFSSACVAVEPTAPPLTSARKVASVELGHGVTMRFVLIAPGSFTMGSDPNFSDGDETPAHKVILTEPFYFGVCEVTQAQWTAVMGANPSRFKGEALPVENVDWDDCQRFMASLGRITRRVFRLPSEAQWEYACRAGTSDRWYFGNDETKLPSVAWEVTTAGGCTHEVATRSANPWGLYDLYGNVWEWCSDYYASHYPAGEVTNPTGPDFGAARVLRGGGWGDDSTQMRSGYRNSMGPDQHNAGTGLRCVMLVAEARPQSQPPDYK